VIHSSAIFSSKRAHIRVQRILDQRALDATLGEPASTEFVRWLHHEFYQDAPEAMLRVGDGADALWPMWLDSSLRTGHCSAGKE
jgi:hypothetical protein